MLRRKILVCAIALLANAVYASPTAPKNGVEFITLSNPQDVAPNGKKVEVIEFFMYHCPACNAFEPVLTKWVKERSGSITFRRVHLPHAQNNDPEAHLFLTLEAMKIEDALHDKVMHTWHVERLRLKSDADNLDWAVKNGVDREKFLSFYNSFSVTARLRNLNRLTSDYKVDSTPTLVIDGRYLTSPSMVAAGNPTIPSENVLSATLQVVDSLIDTAAKANASRDVKK